MKTHRISKVTLAGLFAAAMLSTQLTTRAVITAPYTPDPATLHLYHFTDSPNIGGDAHTGWDLD
jgi:hypothetical protein